MESYVKFNLIKDKTYSTIEQRENGFKKWKAEKREELF